MRTSVYVAVFAATMYHANVVDGVNIDTDLDLDLATASNVELDGPFGGLAKSWKAGKKAKAQQNKEAIAAQRATNATKKTKTDKPVEGSMIHQSALNLVKETRTATTKTMSKEMSKAMLEVPYLKEIMVGGELANLAFEYMKEQTPDNTKNQFAGAWHTAASGRYKAFKYWLKESWGGESTVQQILGDYEDYLSLFATDDVINDRISLHEYWDASRAPGDEGTFEDYSNILNIMGQVGDRAHYIGVRQESRN